MKNIIVIIVLLLFSTGANAETYSASASRTTGVAPLSIFFNAGLADSTPTERPFHDFEYSWNFGDSTSGTWGTDGKSKNIDKGPVASHVYETPGTYTATYTAKNISGSVVESGSFIITVSDPDAVFSGTNTTCISTDTDFTGCPSGATHLTTSSLSILPSMLTSGKRVLLHRGSTWTAPNNTFSAYPAASTTVYLGAYGSCTSPDSMGFCSNAPQINVTATVNDNGFVTLYKTHDWRITDISFYNDKNALPPSGNLINGVHGVFTGGTDVKQFLALRIKTVGFESALGWGHWRIDNTSEPVENAIVGCSVNGFYEYGIYAGADKLTLLGNKVQDCDISHVTRVWWSHLGVISHNDFSGSSITNENGRHALKLHGPIYGAQVGTYAETGGGGLPYPTKFTVVSDNLFGASGPQPMMIAPQDSISDERLSDILVERNKVIGGYGTPNSFTVTKPINIVARYVTVRNNIIDPSEQVRQSSGIYGISVLTNGYTLIPAPLGIRVYNNTIYSDRILQNTAYGITIEPAATDVEVKNNYVSFPNKSGTKYAVVDQSGVAVQSKNVVTDTPHFVDAASYPTINRDFHLASSAILAIDQGTSINVFEDFYRGLRPYNAVFDIGAHEYGSIVSSAASLNGSGSAALNGAGSLTIQ